MNKNKTQNENKTNMVVVQNRLYKKKEVLNLINRSVYVFNKYYKRNRRKNIMISEHYILPSELIEVLQNVGVSYVVLPMKVPLVMSRKELLNAINITSATFVNICKKNEKLSCMLNKKTLTYKEIVDLLSGLGLSYYV